MHESGHKSVQNPTDRQTDREMSVCVWLLYCFKPGRAWVGAWVVYVMMHGVWLPGLVRLDLGGCVAPWGTFASLAGGRSLTCLIFDSFIE